MILNLEHRNLVKSIKSKWIYFGANYSNLKRLSKRINKEDNISLSQEHSLNFIVEKENYKQWLEHQRTFYNDSIEWWMNNLTSMNDLSSFFLLNVSQIKSIENYIDKEKNIKKITVVAENFHLLKFLYENLEKKYDLKRPRLLEVFILFEKLNLIFKGFINYLKIIYFFITNYLYSLEPFKKKTKPSGEVYLFHDLINTSKFNDGIVQSRYFGNFPKWLEDNGKQVVSLPWFYQNLSNKKKIYEELRKRNSFIPEDWLNISNYFESLTFSIKSSFSINSKIEYPNYKTQSLVNFIKYSGLQNKSAIFFRYLIALNKWSKNINSLIFIDHYQNQNYEHTIRYHFKSSNLSKFRSIGYFHSLHSINFLPYLTTHEEWTSKVKPDLIFCPNLVCKDYLEFQGIPSEKIKITSDLQRDQLLNKIVVKKNSDKNLLIILSLFPVSNNELLSKFLEINDYICNTLGIKITIRPHPYMSIKIVKKNLGIRNFPKNWNFSNNDLHTDLNNNYCVVTLHSSVVTDAIFFNCIVATLKTELNVGENFLDFLEDKFPLLKSTDKKNLKNKIEEIYFSKKNFYKEEFNNIKIFFDKNKTVKDYKKIIDTIKD